jgi:ABC-type Mn2+/Zn2+ transport system ATPase subunit
LTAASLVLATEDLDLGYGRTPVLRGVRLELRAGEFWFVVGPNGAGKTTLLRALLGTLAPRSGRVTLDPSLQDAIGFVPQRSAFRDTLPTTVAEFVLLGLAGLRTGHADARARLERALEQVGLRELERQDYRALSGGQRQRALVARALVRRPRLLMLDEPTAGLDWTSTGTLMRYLEQLRAVEGETLLFVSHDLQLAARFATHVAIVHAGRVEAGPAREMLSPERVALAYGEAYPGPLLPSPEGAR